ncbi:MAG: PepSY domain-containing protein [Maricaulaceae bacterium]|nr:PepSY domain-containing protein [Maricaulaceae bacterium]
MAAIRWLIRIHKWVALIVGLQVLLWVLSGLVMTAMPIEWVRAEHTIRAEDPAALDLAAALPPGEAAARAGLPPPARAVLKSFQGRAVYEFQAADGSLALADAATGARLSPIGEETARAVARAAFSGQAEIDSVTFFPAATWESRRDTPTWRIDFADGEGTRLYVATLTGEVIARRNDAWRVFDFFWMLHIMDYEDRTDINNPLVIIASAAALVTTIAGFALLFPWLKRLLFNRRRRKAQAGSPPS